MRNLLNSEERSALLSHIERRYRLYSEAADRRLLKPSLATLELYSNPDTGRRFSFDGYEFTRPIMDDLARRVVCQKCNQVGLTVVATVRTVFALDVWKLNTFYLMPTKVSARDFVVGRLNRLIEASPRLTSLFDVSGVEHKRTIHGVNGYWRGSNSRSGLMSVPVGFLVIDEFDECHTAYDITSKAGSWSAVDLVRKRLTGQVTHHEMDISTPTAPGVGINVEYDASDQRQWIVPCEHCAWKGPLTWEMVKWYTNDRKSASLECPKCKRCWGREDYLSKMSFGDRIQRSERIRRSRQGEWIAQFPGRDVHGYTVNQLMSPTILLHELVDDWIQSQGNEARLTVFYNGRLGLPYQPASTKLTPEMVRRCILPNSRCLIVPNGPTYLGIDPGSIHHWVAIVRDANGIVAVVNRGVLTDLDEVDHLISIFGACQVCVDAGGEPEGTRKLAERWPGTVYRVNYSEAVAGDHIRSDESKQLCVVNRVETLDAMYRRFRSGRVPQGITLPTDIGDEYIQHICSPQRVYIQNRRNGRLQARYVHSTGQPDHYAHATNYALIALAMNPPPSQGDCVVMGNLA